MNKKTIQLKKYLKDNKIELNKASSSHPRDIKLVADVASENLIKQIINKSSN